MAGKDAVQHRGDDEAPGGEPEGRLLEIGIARVHVRQDQHDVALLNLFRRLAGGGEVE